MPCSMDLEDSKPKINHKTLNHMKKQDFMPNLRSLSQKTKKLGLNMFARRFGRWKIAIILFEVRPTGENFSGVGLSLKENIAFMATIEKLFN